MNENVDPDKVEAAAPGLPSAAAAPAKRKRRWAQAARRWRSPRRRSFAWRIRRASRLPPAPRRADRRRPAMAAAADRARRAGDVGDMPITIDALGTVTPLATVTVKTQIAGRLM